MKSIFTYAFLGLTSILMIGSCVTKEKNNSSETHDPDIHTQSGVVKEDDDMNSDWKLVWSDEFDGVRIDTSNWNYQVVEAGRFNDEWQRYTNSDENAFIDNGTLVLKAIHESEVHGMDQYTSARLHTANKQTWKYGKIAARIKLPEGNGIWPAFWMLGANINENGGDTPWPQSGEIDILEFYGSKDDAVVEANIHYADKTDSHKMMGAVPFKLKHGKFPTLNRRTNSNHNARAGR